jgi:ubiquinone biosynthesis protein
VGRLRDRERHEEGRFTRAEVDELLKQTWIAYDQLAPHVPHEPKIGNRMNMLLAAMTLAFLQVLIARGTGRAYATELVGDVAWKVYERWGHIPIALARLRTRDPHERMRLSVEMFLRFPFTPPGYLFNRLPSEEGISLDMLRCPVAEYFRREGASDLCIETWCNLDFPLAEMWGGRLERTQTLAAGCEHCDFRFKAVRPE